MAKSDSMKQSKELVIQKYFDMIYRLAYVRTKDKQLADDVCQDVFLRYIKTKSEAQSLAFNYYFAFLAVSTSVLNASISVTAISASIFLLSVTPAFLRPYINCE